MLCFGDLHFEGGGWFLSWCLGQSPSVTALAHLGITLHSVLKWMNATEVKICDYWIWHGSVQQMYFYLCVCVCDCLSSALSFFHLLFILSLLHFLSFNCFLIYLFCTFLIISCSWFFVSFCSSLFSTLSFPLCWFAFHTFLIIFLFFFFCSFLILSFYTL